MPAKKKIASVLKLQLQAGAATPAPPVGTVLGPTGINIMEFTKAYNAATESMRGNIVPAEVTIYEDRSFSFVTKTPPAVALLKKAAGIDKGSPTPHVSKVGSVSKAQIQEIAETKKPDLSSNSPEEAAKIIEGTARSIGLTVTD